MRTQSIGACASLAGLLLIGCADPSDDPFGYRSLALAVPATVTFDEMNLAPGTLLTNQLASLGVVVAADGNSVEQIGDAAGFGVWPTASGARYLAVNTRMGAMAPAVVLVTFVERLTGAPSTADAVSVWLVDGDAMPLPRVTVTALDAEGAVLESAGTVAETERVQLQSPGIAALRFTDSGGDGHLIDDLTFTLQDDSDGDGVPNSLDRCPATPPGPPVDASGCTCAQRVDLACPPGDPWRNHGAYVSCVAHATNACVADAILTENQKGQLVSTAARSSIGKKP